VKKTIMLSIIAMSFMLLMPCLAQPPTPSPPTPPGEATWVNIVGFVDWAPPTGFLKANAKVGEWAKAHAFWDLPALTVEEAKQMNATAGDFEYSFYAALLVNASTIEPDYINGTWNVYNVTFEYSELDVREYYNSTIEVIVSEAYGALTIYVDRTFELAIDGIDPVIGTVLVHIKVPAPIPIGDVTNDRRVDITDVARVARSFDTRPGRAGYDFNLDLNLDFHINIIDLVMVARNYGKSY